MISTRNSLAKARGDGGVSSNVDRSEDTLLSLLHTSPLACIQTDDSLNILTWNAGAEALLGWRADEVVHHPLLLVLASSDTEKSLSVGQLTAFRADISFKKKSGEMLKVEIWTTVLPEGEGRLFLLQDVTEKKFLEKALLEASEREQRRIGQELHDHLCQYLLGAAFSAKALAGALDRDHSEHAPKLHDLARLINDGVSQVRDISRGLHPVELDSAGLMSALQELANRAGHMTACTFRCDRDVLVKSTDAALNAYRIVQAAVTSALQEANAKKVEIALVHSGNFICLKISDDGIKEGELTSNPGGVAAKTLHYRAQAMQGSLTLEFHPVRGTLVTCLFPS